MTLDCEFCSRPIGADAPANVALLRHLDASTDCRVQFDHLMDNIRSSWTPAMSGA